MRQSELVIGLALSISLALGYLAGRIHESESKPGYIPAAAVKEVIGRTQSGTETLRARLNPEPITETKVRTGFSSMKVIERYNNSGVELTDSKHPAYFGKEARHIGRFVDPDLPYADSLDEILHLGEPSDPDQPWMEDTSNNRVAIGELSHPELDWDSY